MEACRRTTFGLQGNGMSYPGLGSDVKAQLWRTMCCPTLANGKDCVDISSKSLNQMETLQRTLAKRCIGVPMRNHHTAILNALEIQPRKTVIRRRTMSLFSRIFKVDSQMKDICITLLVQYMLHKKLCAGTIVERLVRMEISPLEASFARPLKSS